MNILLIYPKYPDTFWSFKHILSFIGKKATFPPLGLLTVASMLPEQWNKKLVDVNVEKLTSDEIEWADMIFLSAMVVQKESAKEIIQKCKSHDKKVVVGGPLFTTLHKEFYQVDHFILNEAEVTLPLFLKDLEKGRPKKVYTSKIRPDITKTPVPLWSLIRFKDYASMSIQYSRGCPYDCEFCDIVIMNGRKPRTKTPKQLINEINSLKDAGWKKSIFIVDDNFIGNKANVKNMLKELIIWQKKNKYPFTFYTEASINLAEDDKLLTLMQKANFNHVFLGIETPCIDSLKECNKMQNTKTDLIKSVRKIHAYGMQVMGGFIVGFDNDKESIFEAQIRFIQKVGIVTAMVGVLNVLPQTRLWYRLKNEKRLVNNPTGENTDGSINFIPSMGKEKLLEGYKKIVSSIYSHKNYYKRIHEFLKSYKPIAQTKLSKEDMYAFMQSILRIGILSKARFQYWKLIVRTVFTKKKALPLAIRLAIYGFHFEKVSKKVLSI